MNENTLLRDSLSLRIGDTFETKIKFTKRPIINEIQIIDEQLAPNKKIV